ncbi:hypothetical protein MJ017_18805 [Acinetobacter baumannii]|nr:hypothetical protein [Acinetobacter baumannii]MDA3438661.1 hypothetical protein [Acinetobacter baumannii]
MEVKKYASFEYEQVRYLQNAVTNIMNIKQNQIVKVFTIITAVFLSLTLVGMIYAELSGDFPLGDSRQPIYKSLRPFDLVS